LQQLVQSPQPIVVRVIEEPVKSTGVADILIGIKKLRARYGVEPVPDSESLRVTPSSSTP
jgi:hypothetical protein